MLYEEKPCLNDEGAEYESEQGALLHPVTIDCRRKVRQWVPGRPETAFLIRPSGEVLKGLDAFLPLIPNLPGGKFLLWWLRFPPARRLADWGYRMIARHRYQ